MILVLEARPKGRNRLPTPILTAPAPRNSSRQLPSTGIFLDQLGPAKQNKKTELLLLLQQGGCLPAVERVVSRDDVGAVLACQELDAVVEGLHRRPVCLALLNDVQRVPGPPAEQAVLTGRLQAAVRVQAIHQAIWKAEEAGLQEHVAPSCLETPAFMFPIQAGRRCNLPKHLMWQVPHGKP